MSAFQRIVSEKVYEWQRRKMRHQKKNAMGGSSIKGLPQIIGFKVEGNQVKETSTYTTQSSRERRRGKREGQIDIKKVLGIALIAIGCLLILTRCFGEKDKKKEGNEEVTQIEKINTTTPTVGFDTYIQDFNIDEDTLHKLFKYSLKHKIEFAHTLGVWALESYRGTPPKKIYQSILQPTGGMNLENFGLYEDATNVYKQFIYDIESFPIKNKKLYTYENGWKENRAYNGNRKHYGIDIMDKKNEPGKIEVLTMTDGIVENIGWNETGGYRVGIRSDSGAYFYYAHLDKEPDFLKKGDRVYAGECIGYMGDTGYGPEGTRGKFPVHLHVGIGVAIKDEKEYWINPYYLLKYLEENRK